MIKLKSLIRVNEQAPAGPLAPGAPQPLQTPPAPAMPEEQPAVPEPETDTTPAPEDPGEYDWTKDFRTFEDAKNKAEAAAKKKLLDKMNKSLVGKKITVNASRGYGQPKTDYTIDKVKKISVEFWYKEWVVIITDENDKKFFLTPGVNIKIEGGAEGAAPEAEAPEEPEAAPTGAPGEEEPNAAPEAGATPPTTPGAEVPPMGAEVPPAPAEPGAVPGTVPPAVPGQPPVSASPTEQPPAEIPPKKKKRVAEVNKEVVAEDLKSFLMEFINSKIQKDVELINYIKDVKSVISEGRQAQVIRSRIEIPVNHMVEPLEVRDLQLAAKESMWSSGNIGERFSRGSLNVSKVGRVYLMEFVKETGWKS